jgi:hypothetical protein
LEGTIDSDGCVGIVVLVEPLGTTVHAVKDTTSRQVSNTSLIRVKIDFFITELLASIIHCGGTS